MQLGSPDISICDGIVDILVDCISEGWPSRFIFVHPEKIAILKIVGKVGLTRGVGVYGYGSFFCLWFGS